MSFDEREGQSGYGEGLRRAGHYSLPQRRVAHLAASAWVQGPGSSGNENGWSVKRPSKPAHKRFVVSTQAHRVVYLPGVYVFTPYPLHKNIHSFNCKQS